MSTENTVNPLSVVLECDIELEEEKPSLIPGLKVRSSDLKKVRLYESFISWNEDPSYVPNLNGKDFLPLIPFDLMNLNTTDDFKLSISIPKFIATVVLKFTSKQMRDIWVQHISLRCRIVDTNYMNNKLCQLLWIKVFENMDISLGKSCFQSLMWARLRERPTILDALIDRLVVWMKACGIQDTKGKNFELLADILFRSFDNPMFRAFLFLMEPSDNFCQLSRLSFDELIVGYLMKLLCVDEWLREKDNLWAFIDYPGSVIINDEEKRWQNKITKEIKVKHSFYSPLHLSWDWTEKIIALPISLPYYLIMKWFKGKENDSQAVNRLSEMLSRLPAHYMQLVFSIYDHKKNKGSLFLCHYHILKDYVDYYREFSLMQQNSLLLSMNDQKHLMFDLWRSKADRHHFVDCCGDRNQIWNIFWYFDRNMNICVGNGNEEEVKESSINNPPPFIRFLEQKHRNPLVDCLYREICRWMLKFKPKQPIDSSIFRRVLLSCLENRMLRVFLCYFTPSPHFFDQIKESNDCSKHPMEHVLQCFEMIVEGEMDPLITTLWNIIHYPWQDKLGDERIEKEVQWIKDINKRPLVEWNDLVVALKDRKPSLLYLILLEDIQNIPLLTQHLRKVPMEFLVLSFPSSLFLAPKENRIEIYRRVDKDPKYVLPNLLDLVRYCQVDVIRNLFKIDPLKSFDHPELTIELWKACGESSQVSYWQELTDYPCISMQQASDLAEANIARLFEENKRLTSMLINQDGYTIQRLQNKNKSFQQKLKRMKAALKRCEKESKMWKSRYSLSIQSLSSSRRNLPSIQQELKNKSDEVDRLRQELKKYEAQQVSNERSVKLSSIENNVFSATGTITTTSSENYESTSTMGIEHLSINPEDSVEGLDSAHRCSDVNAEVNDSVVINDEIEEIWHDKQDSKKDNVRSEMTQSCVNEEKESMDDGRNVVIEIDWNTNSNEEGGVEIAATDLDFQEHNEEGIDFGVKEVMDEIHHSHSSITSDEGAYQRSSKGISSLFASLFQSQEGELKRKSLREEGNSIASTSVDDRDSHNRIQDRGNTEKHNNRHSYKRSSKEKVLNFF